jgi:hypothetical protein
MRLKPADSMLQYQNESKLYRVPLTLSTRTRRPGALSRSWCIFVSSPTGIQFIDSWTSGMSTCSTNVAAPSLWLPGTLLLDVQHVDDSAPSAGRSRSSIVRWETEMNVFCAGRPPRGTRLSGADPAVPQSHKDRSLADGSNQSRYLQSWRTINKV